MKNLQRWIDAYRTMDQRRRDQNLSAMEAIAAAHPDIEVKNLRLVRRDPTGLRPIDQVTSVPHDVGALVLVTPVVQVK